ncbi:hypothetical protein Pcinc_008911 [Petrolisthes cinctipes]|uniref:Uncharacterized protein n=1 Tax=Petrolisthes cinctipes TaxID=88211 RepID=A0AAE1G840_PETCI|nr:hypothetical protein Pcinc_008911 [Petrolisthes cinctipes]
MQLYGASVERTTEVGVGSVGADMDSEIRISQDVVEQAEAGRGWTSITDLTITDRECRRSYCLREAIVTTKARVEGLRCEAARLEEEMRRLTSASTRLTGRINQTNTTIIRKKAALHSFTTLKDLTVKEYLSLEADLTCLKKELENLEAKRPV